ncbi:MAG TPA: DUF4350 domain-containing protein, partial [Candidatus Elarobacter sp.]|nr:DUF4350 domain-containing protein [Candidatus Elarobacter sp.]
MTRAQAWLAPSRILVFAALALLLMVLFVPSESTGNGTPFSSYATGPAGARALYETLHRLGFAEQRRTTSLASGVDSTHTYAVLAPSQPLTAVERAQLLTAVRSGATLIFTASGDALTDSLGFTISSALDRFHTLADVHVAGGDPDSTTSARSLVLPITATLKVTP